MADKRVFHALLRNNFLAFVEKVFGTLCPGQIYYPNWHIEAIAFQLERVLAGDLTRLIVNMPPRSLKSIIVSVALPAFILGHDPTRRIINICYSADLVKKHSNDFRAILESDWYQELFPSTRISPSKNTEGEIATTKRGSRLATSVNGTLTGRGGDLIIIDDPIKADDANSDSKRNGVNDWFINTALSRLDDKRTGSIILVQQRVHMDDLTGYLLRQSDDWYHLSLPAIALTDETIQISPEKYHHRQAGEALSPTREPLTVLESLKRQYGSEHFAAQYQQTPVPPGGLMIQRRWIKRYTELPPQSEWLMVVQSLDTACKGGPDNDWSVCLTLLHCRDRSWYLIDVWRQRVNYPVLKTRIQELAKQFKPQRVFIEESGTAIALIQELTGRVRGIVGVKPEKDKISRMSAASAIIESGCLYLPERAPWLADFETELFSFPGSQYDDQCDALSQALNSSVLSFWAYITKERWQELVAKSKVRDPRYGR